VKENIFKIGEFFSDEYRRMVGYVRSIIEDSSDWESEDIVQDVMTGFFEAADITRPIENLSAYIYQSLRNRVIDKMRKKNKPLSLDVPDPKTGISIIDIIEDVRCNIENEFVMNELKTVFFESIDNLPESLKTIFIMTEFEGITYREISDSTGIPLGTLLSRKSRAIDRIRNDLNQYKQYMEE